MPSLSFLELFYAEHYRHEIHYLFDLNREHNIQDIEDWLKIEGGLQDGL